MILQDGGCLFAAFVLPDYRNKGISRKLVMTAEKELFEHPETAWLETEKIIARQNFTNISAGVMNRISMVLISD